MGYYFDIKKKFLMNSLSLKFKGRYKNEMIEEKNRINFILKEKS